VHVRRERPDDAMDPVHVLSVAAAAGGVR
jgi:hypothetical protein